MVNRLITIGILLLVISLSISGCLPNGGALLAENPKDGEVDPSLIVCDENPEIVDGDITTSSQIAYPRDMKETPQHPYTIIKFRNPVYVTFIELYTKDSLKNLTISFANVNDTESKSIQWNGLGSSTDIGKEQNKRITIRSKINMMKLTANWIKDNTRSSGRGDIIAIKGPEIYEIKFYTNQVDGGKSDGKDGKKPDFGSYNIN